MEALFGEALKNNYWTVIAKDIRTDKVIGICATMLEKRPVSKDDPSEFDKVKETILKSENSRKLLNVWRYIYSKHDFFEEFDVKCMVKGLLLAVVPEYRQSTVATMLVQFGVNTMNNLKDLDYVPQEIRDYPPEILTYIIVSPYSKKIFFKKETTIVLNKFANKDFILNGKSFADRIGDPDSYSYLCVQKLDAYRGSRNFNQLSCKY
jgi:hypothetical protein